MFDQKCFFSSQGVCSNDVVALSDLRYEENNMKCFPGANTLTEILLLSDDRFYQDRLSLHSTFVCSEHKEKLLKKHCILSYRKCWLCILLQKATPNVSERNINPIQALTIFEQFNIPHYYRKAICGSCRKSLTAHNDIDKIVKHKKAFEWLADAAFNDNDTNDTQSHDSYEEYLLNSSPNSGIEATLNLNKKKRELLNEFLYLCGSKVEIRTTNAYHKLQKQSRANFLASARNLIQHIMKFLAQDDSNDVKQDLFFFENGNSNNVPRFRRMSFAIVESNTTVYDRQLVPVMNGIAEAYENAENSYTRRSILSIVAPKINFSIIQSFIPNITYYRFLAARLHATRAGSGALIERPPRIVCRFEPAQVQHFIDFILSNYVCTDIPFGDRTLTLSNGTKLHVPDTIRNFDSTRIIMQYYKYTTEYFPGFSVLQESTLFKILSECKASTRRAASGLNYFAANGSEAFDNIIELINGLSIDASERCRLANNIRKGKQYLKTDFKTNVARTSRVPEHCICFSLSDPTSMAFSIPCSDHKHDQVCSECFYLAQALQDSSRAIESSINDEEEVKRKIYKFTLAYDAIQAWKSHQLRSVNQDLGRECVLDVLGEDTIYLNLDFAMKWLPVKYREDQTNFFGKRGITWHITVVSRKKEQELNNITQINYDQEDEIYVQGHQQALVDEDNDEESEIDREYEKNSNNFEHTVFVHVIDQCSQDSKLVIAIIDDVLSRLKVYDNSIQQACIRCDNAGCYHSAYTVLSMPTVSEKCGIAIRRMDFADPQGGRGSSDRYAAIIKSHVRRYLNEKHDVTNAEQFVEACLSYGGVKTVNVVECQFKPVHQSAKFQFNNIKQFRNFCFERHGIRVYRAWDVGEGSLLPYIKLINGKVTIGSLDLIKSSPEIIFGSSANNNLSSSIDESLNGECTESIDQIANIFECPEEACISSFVKYGNLLRHLAVGNHRHIPEKVTLMDTAKKMFHSRLANADNKRIISLSPNDFVFDSNNCDQVPELTVGWALPVTRPPVRFTNKQRKFLDEKFNDGILYGRFWKPETVVSEMQNAKSSQGKFIFDINEWLTTSQVRGYFSRIRSIKTQKNAQLSSSTASNHAIYTESEQEEGQDLDEDASAEESLKDDVAVDEAIERITFMTQTNQVVERASKEKRPLSSVQNEQNIPKRSTSSQSRKYQ
ncbi:unnamed protein product [Rotaria sp. Silwood2]|nr:unnamed protein product [Rotaria sp. Silwood2]